VWLQRTRRNAGRREPGSDVEALLATQPSAFHALTAHLSPSEAQALLKRACDAHVEREHAQEPQAEVRERERELLEQLAGLLDDALRALRALPVSTSTPPPDIAGVR
jgi:hypothetical protein